MKQSPVGLYIALAPVPTRTVPLPELPLGGASPVHLKTHLHYVSFNVEHRAVLLSLTLGGKPLAAFPI